jgi:hypothetical protein
MMHAQLLKSSAFAVIALAAAQTAEAKSPPSSSADAGAPIDDHAQSAPIKVEFDASTGSKQASIKLDLLQLSNSSVPGGGGTNDTNKQFTVKLSTPWDSESDAEPVNLDGLASGTELTFEYSFFGTRSRNDVSPRARAIANEARAACTAQADLDFSAASSDVGDSSGADVISALVKARDKKKAFCASADSRSLIAAFLPGKRRAYASEFFPDGAWGLGVHGSVGYDRFSYIDATTLAAGKTSKVGWSAGISATKYFSRSPTAISATFDYESAWKEQDKQILCPASSPAPVACVNNHVGPPQFERSGIARLNLRHRFSDSNGNGLIGISPTASVNVSDGTWGAELPIYLLPGSDDTLTGGIKLGYTSEKKDVTFGIFIGAAFGLSN